LIGAKTFVTTTRIGKYQHADMVTKLRPRLPSLGSILSYGEKVPHDVVALDEQMAAKHDANVLVSYLQKTTITANDVFTICWTSGTESLPKGVPRNHNEWLVIGMGMMDAATLEAGCNILNPFPLVNMAGIGGMMMSWLLTGGKLVQHHPLSLPVFLQQLSGEKINFTVVLDVYKQVTGMAGEYQVEGARNFATLNIGGSAETNALAESTLSWGIPYISGVPHLYSAFYATRGNVTAIRRPFAYLCQ
jgi:acyl-CoA synthetase (AMP-forming)/AMP-acid ligase II